MGFCIILSGGALGGLTRPPPHGQPPPLPGSSDPAVLDRVIAIGTVPEQRGRAGGEAPGSVQIAFMILISPILRIIPSIPSSFSSIPAGRWPIP
jgi:hypothetical protein